MATAVISPDHDTIVAEIFIAAPPARVFQAITSHGEGWKRVLGWLEAYVCGAK